MSENVVAKSMTVTPTAFIGSGITDSSFGTVECIVKPDEYHGVAAEYVAAELGKFLGLPVAPGFITYVEGSPQFVTMRVGAGGILDRGEMWTVMEKDPVNAAGMGIFDALIINSDRHPGNFSMVNGRLFMFDHGHTMFTGGWERKITASFIDTTNIKDAERWIRKVKAIPRSFVKSIFDHLRSIGWPPQAFDDEMPNWDKWETELWSRIKNFTEFVRLPQQYKASEAITVPPTVRRRLVCGPSCSICKG